METLRYHNASGRMVILRCTAQVAFFMEKVIFPFEDFDFSCPADSRVELWTHGITGAELLDTLQSDDLLVSANAIRPMSRSGQTQELNLA